MASTSSWPTRPRWPFDLPGALIGVLSWILARIFGAAVIGFGALEAWERRRAAATA